MKPQINLIPTGNAPRWMQQIDVARIIPKRMKWLLHYKRPKMAPPDKPSLSRRNGKPKLQFSAPYRWSR